MKDDKLYLIHIDECLERIDSYIKDIDKRAFMDSTLIQDAVVRNLQIMSESTQRLSDNLKDGHPEIDWFKISGFRNVLVHDYLGVDIERIWTILVKEFPILRKVIKNMLM
jgi:uncharacterized protein with HEPN domain